MLSDVVELLAYTAFVVAGWLLSPVLGLTVLGAALWWTAQGLDGVKVPRPKVRVPAVRMPKVRLPKPPPAGARES